jgi:hypothetical protein
VLPTLVWPAHCTLEEGRRSPRKGDGCLFRTRPGQRRTSEAHLLCHHQPCAVIPATTTPSRALQCHPRRCGSTGRQDAATPAAMRLAASRQPHPRVSVQTTTREELSSHTATLEAAFGRIQGTPRHPARSKIRQNNCLLHNTMHHTATRNQNSATRL